MDEKKWPAKAMLPIAVPGIKYVALTILATGMFFYFGWFVLGMISLALTCFVTWFFRDPDRMPPEEPDALVSPADGKVIIVQKLAKSEYLDGPCQKVSIFMNVFNVHVNRIPFDGVVENVVYTPGKFFNASFDKASEHNERNAIVVRIKEGRKFAFVQIAGLVARRIVNCVGKSEQVKKGARYGMIQFGSRLDLFLPLEFEIQVKIGEKTSAGTTVIGRMK